MTSATTITMGNEPKNSQAKHILFLDGECLFCQRSAQLLYRWDRSKQIYFTTLQGQTAEMLPDEWKRLTDKQGRPAGTAVLIENANQPDERRWRSADAILRSLQLTGSFLAAFGILRYLPRLIKDAAYRFIARNRHHLKWGKPNCTLPSQDFKGRFLP